MRQYEENLSAKQKKKSQETRISQKDEQQIGEVNLKEEKGKGAEEIGGIRRIKGEKEIRSILRNGRRINQAHITISYLCDCGGRVGFAFLVGKRVGKAVVRNKVKRRLREIARQRRDLLPEGISLCIMANQSASQCRFQELEEEVIRAFKKLREYEMERS